MCSFVYFFIILDMHLFVQLRRTLNRRLRPLAEQLLETCFFFCYPTLDSAEENGK